ncbi:MAG: D-alanyl-D-alanine carboxypeptidase family protein, partial [Bacillota bacterium]
MKKISTILIIVLTLTTIMSSNIMAVSDFDVSVDKAILIEAETGEVLFEKNADEVVPPASITKIMTLLLAMEAIENGELNLDDEVNISKRAESMGGSQIYLPDGVTLKLEELLKAVAMASANDASVAVAEAVGGSYGNFIHMMNQKAKELEMENTKFVNSTGLPAENHYSTARDISIMARELVKHEKVLDWSSNWLEYIELPKRKAMVVNTNKLIKKYDGLDGLKTGHTQEAGFCLAGTAKNNEMRLISIVLDADTDQERERVTTNLLDYGFNNF